MTRYTGPDPNTRTAWQIVSNAFRSATGETAVFYTDPAGTTLAVINYYDPAHPTTPQGLIPGSALPVNYLSEFPTFWFPDGVTVLYASINGGPLAEVHAGYDPQITGLTTRVATLESGGGAVPSVFGRTGVVTAQTGDYTKAQVGLGNVDNTSDASKPVSTAQATANTAVATAAAADATTKANAAQSNAIVASDSAGSAALAQTNAATDATTKADAAQAAAAADATTKANNAAAASLPKPATQTKTSAFNAAAGIVYLVDTTTAAVTATLPAASVTGQQVVIKFAAGPNPVNVAVTGGDTIGATATSAALTLQSEIFEFTSSGAGQWNLTGGNKTIASLDARYQKTVASVTDRAQWETFGLSSTGTTGRTTRTYYVATGDCVDLTCWWVGATADESTPLANTFTVKATVELVPAPQSASGTLYPLTFQGAATITVNPGQIVRSDPLPVNLAKGNGFYVRTYSSVVTSGTDTIPLGRQHVTALFEASVLSSDLANSTGTWSGSASFSCGPVRIDGTSGTRLPTLAMIGSSTFEGIGDTQDTSTPGGGVYGWGWVRRLCNGNVGIVHLAKASELGSHFTVAAYRARGPLSFACDYAIEGYGSNDINSAHSLATVQADKLRIWTAWASRRCKVWTPTLHPNLTTSTDSFATTGNQTAAATNSIRTGLNDWIRAGAPIDPTTKAAVAIGTTGALLASQSGHPLTGWIEVADTAETSRGSGIYKVGYTTDGQHLTSTGCAAVVAALTNPFV